MLNFDEELKKFQRSTEKDELEDLISSIDLTDMNDIMFDAIKKIEGKKFE